MAGSKDRSTTSLNTSTSGKMHSSRKYRINSNKYTNYPTINSSGNKARSTLGNSAEIEMGDLSSSATSNKMKKQTKGDKYAGQGLGGYDDDEEESEHQSPGNKYD